VQFETGQIIEDSQGGRSIVIEKNEFGITYFMIHSPKDPEYLHRRFKEPESQMNRHYKIITENKSV
tara:strand:+ start:157 stop:354 length:198 start_codon:yes stop_codon:yes gene_type:complete